MKPAKVRRRLRAARASRDHVAVFLGRDRSEIEGYVARVGRKWVALAVCDEGLYPDGLVLLRLRTVRRVVRVGAGERLRREALRRRGAWPPSTSVVRSLDRTGDLIRELAVAYPLLSLHTTTNRRHVFYVGAVRQVRSKSVQLHDIGPAARWRGPIDYRFGEILRIDVGDGYQATLLEVGGPPPVIKGRKRSS